LLAAFDVHLHRVAPVQPLALDEDVEGGHLHVDAPALRGGGRQARVDPNLRNVEGNLALLSPGGLRHDGDGGNPGAMTLLINASWNSGSNTKTCPSGPTRSPSRSLSVTSPFPSSTIRFLASSRPARARRCANLPANHMQQLNRTVGALGRPRSIIADTAQVDR